jgi:hypothetical protein
VYCGKNMKRRELGWLTGNWTGNSWRGEDPVYQIPLAEHTRLSVQHTVLEGECRRRRRFSSVPRHGGG